MQFCGLPAVMNSSIVLNTVLRSNVLPPVELDYFKHFAKLSTHAKTMRVLVQSVHTRHDKYFWHHKNLLAEFDLAWCRCYSSCLALEHISHAFVVSVV